MIDIIQPKATRRSPTKSRQIPRILGGFLASPSNTIPIIAPINIPNCLKATT